MEIQRLQVQNIRNLSRVSLAALNSINIFFGANGSGKTSLLEAVHLLLVGRSFRHSQFKPLLTEGQSQCVVFGELVSGAPGRKIAIGLQRERDGKPLIKLDGERLAALAELVRVAPVQVLNSDSFELLTGGPSQRREYLDWGLFHVEPQFFPAWQQAQRALKQRNSLIRHDKIDRPQLLLWSREYARYGEQLDTFRSDYLATLQPLFERVLNTLNPDLSAPLSLSYSRGWGREHTLEALLVEGIDKDLQQGFTRFGPHRADLKVQLSAGAAAEILSRGQLKLVVASLRLAQAELLQQMTDRKCIFLIDDLPAELDRDHRRKLCRALEQLGLQVFMTCIELEDLKDCWEYPNKLDMFHVEHGSITLAEKPDPATVTARGI
jgi:DNA replication and repair protein RecF